MCPGSPVAAVRWDAPGAWRRPGRAGRVFDDEFGEDPSMPLLPHTWRIPGAMSLDRKAAAEQGPISDCGARLGGAWRSGVRPGLHTA